MRVPRWLLWLGGGTILAALFSQGGKVVKTIKGLINPYQAEFERATSSAGVPLSWASSEALLNLVKRESAGFKVDAQNPTSTAYGLFQFIKKTWAAYLPEVPHGTADAYWQAVGGFRYIKSIYKTPERAWAFWQATVGKNAGIAPADLQAKALQWIASGGAGY